MQIVKRKLEQSISQKLKNLPLDTETAFFVEDTESNSVRATASRIKRETGMEFKTEKARRINDKNEIIDGITIWKVKE